MEGMDRLQFNIGHGRLGLDMIIPRYLGPRCPKGYLQNLGREVAERLLQADREYRTQIAELSEEVHTLWTQLHDAEHSSKRELLEREYGLQKSVYNLKTKLAKIEEVLKEGDVL